MKAKLLKKLRTRFEYAWEQVDLTGPNTGRYYRWVLYDRKTAIITRGGVAFINIEPKWLIHRMVQLYFQGNSLKNNMKKYTLLAALLLPLMAVSQKDTLTIGNVKYGIGPSADTVFTNNMLIGLLSGAGISKSSYCIIIGDFKEAKDWPSYTIHYDREYWYFRTRMGKQLLKYLDRQTTKPRTKERIMIIQEHIKKYYLFDMVDLMRGYHS